MLENSDDLMSVVVLEAGAAWPSWLTEYQRLAPNAIVIAQAASESAEPFQARVIHRVEEAAHASDARVRVGVIVAAPESSHAALRQNVARALIRAMSSSVGEAELVLAADTEEVDGMRHELFALAGALCEELGGTRVSVRVRFSHAQSGVIPSVSASTPDVEPLLSKA